jgi:hypothetical protein
MQLDLVGKSLQFTVIHLPVSVHLLGIIYLIQPQCLRLKNESILQNCWSPQEMVKEVGNYEKIPQVLLTRLISNLIDLTLPLLHQARRQDEILAKS